MNRETIKKMIILNTVHFPQFYSKTDDQTFVLLINSWYELFKNYDDEVFEKAYEKALLTAQYPVKPADITAIIKQSEKSKMPTADELFDIALRTAIEIKQFYSIERGWENEYGAKKSGYDCALEIYNKMPSVLKEWKGDPKSLVNWYLGLDGDGNSYERHDFERIISQRLERREQLGIGYNEEFKPIFYNTTGLLKDIPDKKQIGGGK